MTSLHVIIPTHARLQELQRTLSSLAACEQPPGYRDVIVVENGSREGTEAIVERAAPHLCARYMYVERANKSHALNEALNTLTDGFVVFLDDDVRLGKNVLCAYADAATDAGRGTFFGGPTAVDYEEEPADWIKAYLPVSARGWQPRSPDEARNGSFLGFNWAAFVEDIKQVGGFNERRGPGTGCTGQENEMQRRLKRAGLQAQFVPDALVWHYVPRVRCSPEWIIKRAYRHGIAQGLYLRDRTLAAETGALRLAKRWVYQVRVIERWMESAVRAEIAHHRYDEREHFEARYELSKHKGIMRGYAQSHNGTP